MAKSISRDQGFELGSQFAIAGERERKIGSGLVKASGSLDQKQLSLLFAEPANADQVSRFGISRWSLEESRLETAAHDMDLVPFPVFDKAKQLAAAK